MTLLTEGQVRTRAKVQTTALNKTALALVKEAASLREGSFDVFLSHARVDEELVLGVKLLLEDAKMKVYVDWIDDPMLDRTRVTPNTAAELRKRMKQSKSLMYLFTANAKRSNWMPWELGYFDGFNGNVAVLPVVGKPSDIYSGHEFVGLYPYVDFKKSGSALDLCINRADGDYLKFGDWQSSWHKLRPSS